MRIAIVAVGRMRAGPEATLVADYIARFGRAGRPHGLGPASVLEVEVRTGGSLAAEAERISAVVPRGARVLVLDERGEELGSRDFAERLRGWADGGVRDLALVIGGADGLDPTLKAQADGAISLGRMVWPHMLVRAMVAEQLYRAATILAGGPYHRD